MIQVNIHQAKTQLSKLIQKAINGEDVIIAKHNKPVVKLVQVKTAITERKIGSAKGQVKIASDFDKPLEDFSEYTG